MVRGMPLITHHALERVRPHYSIPCDDTETMMAAAARTTIDMDGTVLQSSGVLVDGMSRLVVSMMDWLNGGVGREGGCDFVGIL